MTDTANNPAMELAGAIATGGPAEKPKRGRGRSPGFRMSDAHRVKIQKSNILRCLLDHAEGKRKMGQTQVTAALGLLKKVLPDLQSVTVSGDDDADPLRHVHTIERRIVRPGD